MKNLIQLFLLSCLLTVAIESFAQQQNRVHFARNIGSPNALIQEGNTEDAFDENGNQLIAIPYTSNIRVDNQTLSTPCRFYKTALALIDSAGTVKWINEIAGEASVRDVQIARAYDGNWIIAGNSLGPLQLGSIRLNHIKAQGPPVSCRVPDTTGFAFLAKIDKQGNYLWAHKISGDNVINGAGLSALVAGPGGIVVVIGGGISANQTVKLFLNSDTSIYVQSFAHFTFSHEGKLISLFPYDAYAGDILGGAGLSSDSLYLFRGGRSRDGAIGNGPVNYLVEGNGDDLLYKADRDGFIVKHAWIHGPFEEAIADAKQTKSGIIVAVGTSVGSISPPNVLVNNKFFTANVRSDTVPGVLTPPRFKWIIGLDEDMNLKWSINDSLLSGTINVIATLKSDYFVVLYSTLSDQITGISRQRIVVYDARTGKAVSRRPIDVSWVPFFGSGDFTPQFDPVGRLNFYIERVRDSLPFPIFNNYRVRVPGNNSVLLGTTICDLTQAEISTRTGSSGICTGDSAVFTCEVSSEGPIVYRWQRNGLDIPGADQPRYVTRLSGKYRCIVQNRLGCIDTSAADSVFLINELPPNGTLAAKGALAFCEGDSVNLAARSPQLGVTYRWMRNGLVIDGSDSILAAKKSGVYKAVVTSAAGCSFLTDSIIVKVTNLPAAYIDTSAGTIKCVNQPVVLFTTRRPGYSFQWYRDNNLVPNQTDASLVTAQPGSYRVQITNPQGCGVMSPAMPVKILPNSGLLLESSANTLKCPNDEVLLYTRFTKAGTQLEWRRDGQVITNFRNDSLRTNLPGRYTVHVVGNTTGLCAVQSNDIIVYNHPVVNINITSGPGINSFCEGDSLPLIASDINGYTYTWLKDGNPQGVSSSRLWAKSTGNYQVQALSPNGCPVSSNVFTATATPAPSNQVTITGSLSLCSGDTVVLEAIDAGASYQWLRNNQPVSSARKLSIDSSGFYQVILRNGANCESRSQTYQVSVAPAINAQLVATGSVLVANPSGAAYQWFFQNQPVSGANGQILVAQISGEYRVVVTQGNCSDTSAVQLVIGGVSSATAAGFRISPIPATHTLNVTLPAGMSTAVNAQLINLLGQTVWQGVLPAAQNSIHISALPAGQYLLQLQTVDGVYLQRVVRE